MLALSQDMYEDGDDDMKKIIAESMMKARSGEKNASDEFDGGMANLGV